MAGIGLLSRCLQVDIPKHTRITALQARGQCYFSLRQVERAIVDQTEALTLGKPRNVWPLVMLGAYYRELGKYDQSLAALHEARNYDEDGPGTGPGMAVFYHTGMTLYQGGRFREAIAALTEGLPKQPGYGYAYYFRGLSHDALGEHEQALSDFKKAVELTPDGGYEAEIESRLVEAGVKRRDTR